MLLASVVFVPLFQKIPGGEICLSAMCMYLDKNQYICMLSYYIHFDILGSPVLGYLAAGVLIGPYGLSIIRNVHGTKAIAEFGVVFLLFNIGLEVQAEWF